MFNNLRKYSYRATKNTAMNIPYTTGTVQYIFVSDIIQLRHKKLKKNLLSAMSWITGTVPQVIFFK